MTPQFLGQHFLTNRNIARKMVRLFHPGKNPILEIGAGRGVLSEMLVESYPENAIILVEMDEKLHSSLVDTFGAHCRVLRENILDIRLDRLSFPGKFSLIGNIPYYLSKNLIDWIIGEYERIENGIFMMQKEFVDKLTPPSSPGKNNAQHIMFNARFRPEKVMQINPGSFSPPPKVVSLIFSFKAKNRERCITDSQAFYRFLKICFRSRRKTLANNLHSGYAKDTVEEIFARTGMDIFCRAEQLGLNDFIRIFAMVSRQHPGK